VGQRPAVQQDVPFLIAANERAPAQDVEHARPSMAMEGRGVPGGNASIEYAHCGVLKQQAMILWRRSERIQMLGPRFRGQNGTSGRQGKSIL